MSTLEFEAVRDWRLAMGRAGFVVGRGQGVFHFSQLLAPNGDRQAAERAYRRLLGILPDHKDALEGLIFLLQLRGSGEEALEFRRKRLVLHARDLGVTAGGQGKAADYLLAGEGWISQPDKAPPEYIRGLFDQYSANFDTHLVDKLDYRVPDLLFDIAPEALGEPASALDILDLGCGTGLAGERFRSLAKSLQGVDLSCQMLAKARARGIYRRLEQGDIVEVSARYNASYDLVLAADVLIYLGDLFPVFPAVRRCLRDGGHFLLSVEKGLQPGFRLRSTGRYQHEATYVEDCARKNGFELLCRREVVLRIQDGKPVWGNVFALRSC